MILNASASIDSWIITIHPKDHFVYGLGKAYGSDKIVVDLEHHRRPNRSLFIRSMYSISKTKVNIIEHR